MWSFHPCKPQLGPGITDFSCLSRAVAQATSQGTQSLKETERQHLQDEQQPPRMGEALEIPWQWDNGETQQWDSEGTQQWDNGGIQHTYSLWLEGGLYLLALQLVPVDVAEEGVFLDVPLPLGATAQALGGVLGHQLGTAGSKQSQPVPLLP